MNKFEISNQIAQNMNDQAICGILSKEEMESWAEKENEKFICIKWKVSMVESHDTKKYPKLIPVKYI